MIYAENVSQTGRVIMPTESLYPGDSVYLSEGGKLGIISNYYHTLEMDQPGWVVIPGLSIKYLSDFWVRPKLEKVMDSLRFYKAQPVKAGLSYLSIYWPDETPHGKQDGPCLLWDLRDWNRDFGEYRAELILRDLYRDSLSVFSLENHLIKLNWKTDGSVAAEIKKSGLLIAEVQIRNSEGLMESEEAAVLFRKDYDGKIRPQSPCEAKSALEYFAIALYLENNFSPREEITEKYYRMMRETGEEQVFEKIWEMYQVRKGE